MDRLEISLGDFLKNAGITGLSYALENYGAREGVDYGISDDKYTFWIDRAFALDTDWTDVYFKAFEASRNKGDAPCLRSSRRQRSAICRFGNTVACDRGKASAVKYPVSVHSLRKECI